MNNTDIRKYAEDKNIYLWRIAEKLKITDTEFSKKLRHELSDKEKKEIFKIIDELEWEGY